jgi:type II secretory ATPase GspE/PulE/Tfp pilus assembly ATPase PilB-like protein
MLKDVTARKNPQTPQSNHAVHRRAAGSFTSPIADGWQKCLAGVTSVEEVLRVTREE